MRFLLTGLSTLAGFLFSLGGPWNATAQESRNLSTGIVVIARQSPSMTPGWYESHRQKLLTVLSSDKAKPPTKRTTKPTRKTKTPKNPQAQW